MPLACELGFSDAPSALTAVLAIRQRQFSTLAAAWLAAGASAFGVTSRGQVLAAWPRPNSQLAGGLTAPLIVGDIPIGELCVAGLSSTAAETRLTADAALIAQLAQHERELDGIAEELVQTQDQLLALYDLARVARSHLSLPETLAALACEAARLVETDSAGVIFVSADGEPILGSHGHSVPELTALLAGFRRLPPDGRELLVAGTAANPELATHGADLLMMPIRVRDRTDAALALVRGRGRAPFASPNIKLARAIAEQAGSQIENVLLYEETLTQARLETEMALARSVQMRLLPTRAPSIRGLELAGRAAPALQVGGDFYDFISTPSQGSRLCTFTVGDVSGKGLPAALVMAMARTVLRSKTSGGASPAQMLDGANAELYDDLTEVAMFATVFVGQYDSDTRTLHYANAGHSPVMYCPVGGKARLLEADGTALGVLPVSLCQDYSLPFGHGALLVAGTDGFSEASNAAGEMYGYERLLHLVESLADRSAGAIAEGLFAAIGDFAAGHLQEDDRTLIVAKGVVP
jgi:phosphoserine phosphatase RsbU/P